MHGSACAMPIDPRSATTSTCAWASTAARDTALCADCAEPGVSCALDDDCCAGNSCIDGACTARALHTKLALTALDLLARMHTRRFLVASRALHGSQIA